RDEVFAGLRLGGLEQVLLRPEEVEELGEGRQVEVRVLLGDHEEDDEADEVAVGSLEVEPLRGGAEGDAEVGDLLGAGVREGAALGHRERPELLALGKGGLELRDGDAGGAGGHDLKHLLEGLVLRLRGEAALDELGIEERRKLHGAVANYSAVRGEPSSNSARLETNGSFRVVRR